MDPFEEFEFKPLTDGLGFHKKKTAAAPAASPSTPTFLKDQGLELIEEPGADLLRSPLPRKKSTAIPAIQETKVEEIKDSGAVEEILKTLQKNKHLNFETSVQKALSTPSAPEFKKTTWSFSASLLDGMLVLAASLLCMILLLLITKVDLIANFRNPDNQGMIFIATASLFLAIAFIYLTVNRIFLGYTPGEWAFDQRIGKPQDLNTASYSLRVIARSLLIVATGFIVFPLLSLVLKKDLVGSLVGAELTRKA